VKALIIGSGAREHALAWKLLQDDPSIDLIAAPGNPGIATLARCIPVRADDVPALVALAHEERPDLTVVGPEAPLERGIVDAFRAEGFAIFGPTRAAARIETSKRFAKELMLRAGVPTGRASTHTDVASAIDAIHAFGAPVVIKASGLAAGKGVIVADSVEDAERAVRDMLEGNAFGDAGHEVLVEEFLQGEELSIFGITDGIDVLMLAGAQDHKRLLDGDTGPNTGGMGAYAPVSIDTRALRAHVYEEIFIPTLDALASEGATFTGLLYAGLMLTTTGPKVIEFNCRFGDPETEALLPLMASSLLEPMLAVARGESIASIPEPEWKHAASVTTVVAAGGYPERPRTGDPIAFPPASDDVYVFHAGTRVPDGVHVPLDADPPVVTAGGRVLAITAVAPTLERAAAKSREVAERVRFEGKQIRHDIAWRELARLRAVHRSHARAP
jgi:phosphoribosylamine--glycine ligase